MAVFLIASAPPRLLSPFQVATRLLTYQHLIMLLMLSLSTMLSDLLSSSEVLSL